MGGGGAMRAAARFAVLTGGSRGGAVVETMPARSSLRPPPQAATVEQTGSLRVEQGGAQRAVYEMDDWELMNGFSANSDDDDLILDRYDSVQPRLVFGPVPTLDETKEATSELTSAVDMLYLSSPKSSRSMNSLSSAHETKACITHESVSNSAMQAFRLLKENPSAQSVVASIASDPNVWNAVMQNQSLVEFLESEKKCVDFDDNESTGSTCHKETGKPDGLMGIFEDVKRTVLDMVGSLSTFIQSLFPEPNIEIKAESSEGNTRTLFAGGSLMALAMMVIMVVVMKRG